MLSVVITTPSPQTTIEAEKQLSDYAEDLRLASINTSSAQKWISPEQKYSLWSKVALDLHNQNPTFASTLTETPFP
jgi:hypothetical protein